MPPAQVVVVHGRQIIMDQGIGVDHLQSAGHGQGFAGVAAYGFGPGQAEDGPEALAPGEEAVAHGLHHPEGRPPARRQIAFQGAVYKAPAVFQVGFSSPFYIHNQWLAVSN
jgi:hypothetical protein